MNIQRHRDNAAITALAFLLMVLSTVLSSKANTLFGGVAHSELLPAAHATVPFTGNFSAESPKSDRQENNAPQVQRANNLPTQFVQWNRIPQWMAGKWTKQGDQTISYTDLRRVNLCK